MKNPRTFLLLSVIVAVLLLGVAYAAIQNITLTINGTAQATPDQANFDVRFTDTTSWSGKSRPTLTITGNTTATMQVTGLTAKGDTVTAIFNVKNYSADLYANLSRSVTNSNTEYFKVTSALGKTTLAPNETTTFKITVELIKTPITGNVSTTITGKAIASPVNGGDSYYVYEDEEGCRHSEIQVKQTFKILNSKEHEILDIKSCRECGITLSANRHLEEHTFSFYNNKCAICGYIVNTF